MWGQFCLSHLPGPRYQCYNCFYWPIIQLTGDKMRFVIRSILHMNFLCKLTYLGSILSLKLSPANILALIGLI